MTAIDETAPEPALSFGVLVEMDLGGVLVEPGGKLVLGLFHGHAVDVVDLLADGIVAEPELRSGKVIVPVGGIEQRRGIAEGIVASAREIAEKTEIKAICCFTHSGTTALLTARERPRVPIIALTPFDTTARRLTLSWGVNCFDSGVVDRFKMAVVSAVRTAREGGYAKPTDHVVVTAGVPFNVSGSTNILRIAPCEERLIFAADPE